MSKSIIILSPGKTKERYLKDGIMLYEKKIRHFSDIQFDFIDIKSTKKGKKTRDIIEYEGEKICGRIGKLNNPFIIVLEEYGKIMSSIQFASKFQELTTLPKDLVFIIGGAFGISDKVRKLANFSLSLSKLTYLHEMTRVILLEQIYRAFQINNGSEYHK
ncbi:23S rRNA (pseudouridine(1915)-N(3))-methyltransferase RlmH [bacterium]|nr:23S rRNA (pseudouridine(1915)-N(3))-methyltransferase RlmH [bacterium]